MQNLRVAQGEPAVAALEAQLPQGWQGLGHKLSVFLRVPFTLVTWDFLETVLPALELIKALSSLAWHAVGFGTQELIEEVSDHLL